MRHAISLIVSLLFLYHSSGRSRGGEPENLETLTGKGWKLEHRAPTQGTLPRVLLIGDSTLHNYFGDATAHLQGKAYVDAWMNGYCQSTPRLTEMVAEVISKGGPYEVIHLNMGLHGLTKGRIPEAQFEPLTRKLIEAVRAAAPRAKVIWASTTPLVDPEKPGAFDPVGNPIVISQNQMAAHVMNTLGVPINDLYTLMLPHLDDARPDGVHWRPRGSALQAQAVATAVEAALQQGGAR